MEEKDWGAIGIVWSTEPVSKQMGTHATDKKVLGQAQIPSIVDLDKFRLHFGDESILGAMNGTSHRVAAQAVCRQELLKDAKVSVPVMRNAVYNRLKGTRNTGGGTRVVTIYSLPNGQKYTGTDLVEFQQAYTAALVEQGVPSDVAITIANQQVLA